MSPPDSRPLLQTLWLGVPGQEDTEECWEVEEVLCEDATFVLYFESDDPVPDTDEEEEEDADEWDE